MIYSGCSSAYVGGDKIIIFGHIGVLRGVHASLDLDYIREEFSR